MELKVKFLEWTAGLPVVMLNEETAKKIGVHANDRVSLRTLEKYPKEMFTIIDLIDGIVKPNEIAVSSEIKRRMNLRSGQKIEIEIAPKPKSFIFIKKKLNNKALKRDEVAEIIRDIVNNSLSEPEIALFVTAMYDHGMNLKETTYLIDAILETGNKLRFDEKFVVDKHCIGGVPGNRTTPIVVSICVAAGLIMPKSSSRAITSAAGTADVIEAIARVEFSLEELKKIVRKTGGCMVWGGGLGLVPADAKIIQIEKVLSVDPEAQLLASIMSKKLAVGSKYILIDIPYGDGAKVDKKKALRLKRKFEALGDHFHKKLKVVLTDGRQPVGNGIGAVLEVLDVINVLDPKKIGPKDLEEKSVFLAGEILELTGKAKKGKGEILAQSIINSGAAFTKFKEIIKAQGGHVNNIKLSPIKKEIYAKHGGIIEKIDNKEIALLATTAGCPVDKSAGVYLHCKKGCKIEKGDLMLTLYAESESRLKTALRMYNKLKPVKFR